MSDAEEEAATDVKESEVDGKSEAAEDSAAAEEEEEDLLSSAAFLTQKVNVLEKELNELQEKTATVAAQIDEARVEWGSKRLRLETDFENFKARHVNMTRAAQVDAKVKLLTELLPILDNFDRARTAINPEGEVQEALDAEYKQMLASLMSSLQSQGLEKIATVGEEFDYNIHMAIQQVPSDEYNEGVVSGELQSGYTFAGKLVRAAYVTVASG